MTEVEGYRMSLTRHALLYISIPSNQKTAPMNDRGSPTAISKPVLWDGEPQLGIQIDVVVQRHPVSLT